MSTSTPPVNADAIAAQLGDAYDRFGAAERLRHVELLGSIQRPKDVALHAEPIGSGHWKIIVSTSDCIGALSAIAGLFAVHNVNIHSVDVFTLEFEEMPREDMGGQTSTLRGYARRFNRRIRSRAPSQPTRRILDIFEVNASPEVTPDFWEHFKVKLEGLISLLVDGHHNQAQESIIEGFAGVLDSLEDVGLQLLPISIEIDNDLSDSTKLTINSADTLGFLFAYTNALTTFGVNIERAEIHTIRGEVWDTFWLTESSGKKILSEKRLNDLRVATALIKQFTYLLPRSTNPSQALRQFNAMMRQMLSNPDWSAELHDLSSPKVLEILANLMGVSQFLWEDFLRMQHENLFPVLLDTPSLNERKPKEKLRENFREQSKGLNGHSELVAELNRFKDREMFRIDLRHISRMVDFQGFANELSDLAEVVVEEAAALAFTVVEGRFGIPTLEGVKQCAWSVCALGKFGGRELGYGSDIELIFVYEGEGVTNGASPTQNSLFFGELVRTFLATVKAQREGIFEIDLRLRPHGNKGPMATSIEEFGKYYSQDGPAQQFERLALVKLRFVAGDSDFGERVVRARDEFVYSGEQLDFDNIRHLRSRQADELVESGKINAKYSPGGLVDMEYYVQASQIEAGHSDPDLRVTNTLEAINALALKDRIDGELAKELRETYAFLRRLIDGLRIVRGHAKDLRIPPADSREFAYLAQRLQFASTKQLQSEIVERMRFAASVWN